MNEGLVGWFFELLGWDGMAGDEGGFLMARAFVSPCALDDFPLSFDTLAECGTADFLAVILRHCIVSHVAELE